MVIIGAGGLAREVVTTMEIEHFDINNIVLFDNVNTSVDKIHDHWPVLHTWEQLSDHLQYVDRHFITCIANPLKRFRVTQKVIELGGILTHFISNHVVHSQYDWFSPGVIIQPGCIMPRGVILKEGVFLNAGNIVGHDSVLERYVSLGPGCRILGSAHIGEFSYIGTNSVILPNVKIGKMVRVGIGKVVDKDLPDNTKFE